MILSCFASLNGLPFSLPSQRDSESGDLDGGLHGWDGDVVGVACGWGCGVVGASCGWDCGVVGAACGWDCGVGAACGWDGGVACALCIKVVSRACYKSTGETYNN